LQEHYLICEGEEDSNFIEELIKVRPLPIFERTFIGQNAPDKGRGIDALAQHLKSIIATTDFRRTVRHVVLLADSEVGETQSLKKICGYIEQANREEDVSGFYSVPTEPFVKAVGAASSFTVIFQPGGGVSGCLETVLNRFLSRRYPTEMACVEALLECAGIKEPAARWNTAKLDKARLRSAIAIINKANPGCSVSFLWKRHPGLIPLTEEEFTPVWNWLSAFLAQ
jgi:hypothetical protein